MARTVVIDPKGVRGTLPDEVVDDYVKNKGYRVVTEAENHPIRAGVQAAVRGFTSGVSDYSADTPEARTGTEQLRDENPVASTIGNVIGQVGQAIAIPELGVGRGLLTRAAGVATKNSLAGMGPQISEAALKDKPINKELLLADMAFAGLTGTVIHGGVAGTGKLLSRAASKAGEFAASERVINAADSVRARVIKKDLGLSDDIFKYADEKGLLSALDHDGIAALSAEAQRKAGYQAIEGAEHLAKVYPDLKAAAERLKQVLTDPNANPKELELLISTFKSAEEAAAAPAVSGTVVPKAAPAKTVLGLPRGAIPADEGIPLPIPKQLEAGSTPRGQQLTQVFENTPRGQQPTRVFENVRAQQPTQEFAKDAPLPLKDAVKRYDVNKPIPFGGTTAEMPAVAAPVGKGTVNMRAPVEPAVEAAAPAVEEAVFSPGPAAPKAQVSSSPGVTANIDEYFKAKQVFDAASARMGAGLGDGVAQPAIMAGIFGGPKAAAAVAAGGVARNAIAQKGGPLFARALEKISEGEVLPRVLKGFQSRIDSMVAMAPELLAPYTQVLAGASAQGADALFAVHSKLAQSAQGGDYLAKLGMEHETPEQSAAYGRKLAMLEALESQRAKFENDLDKHVNGFFKDAPIEDMPKLNTKSYEAKLAAVKELLRDPTTMINHAPTEVLHGAPGLTMESGTQFAQAAQFLMDRAPKPTDSWKPKALQAPFNPAPGDIEKWMRYVRAVENPRSVAIQLSGGRVDAEAVEVMQAIYPALFAQVQTRVMAQLQGLKKPLPYAKQAALAQVFGPQIMGISPQQTMLLQAIHQSQQQAGQQNPGQGPSQDGRQMVNTNKNMETQTQRLEGRSQ